MPTQNIAASSGPIHNLTDREIKCLSLVAVGETVACIAAVMSLPEGEIDGALVQAGRKLGARNRLHAVSLALSQGLLEHNGRQDTLR
ncbi:MAG: LuxR C-terminal-related transcriptional regulator [Allorhizobium sp.]